MPQNPQPTKNLKTSGKSAVKAREFNLVSSFKLGYRNREDQTNLPPGVLVVGSKNVLTNVSERIQVRGGYTLDGAANTSGAPILSSYDWQTKGNNVRNLRAGFLTSAGNDGKLQFRYSNGTWYDLLTGLTSVDFNFTKFWDDTEQLRVCLMVNGASSITEWNGAAVVLSARTTNTLTKTGDTWAASGFYTTGNKQVIINGTTYTYTGGETTTTLTGVTGDPTGEAVGSIVYQKPVTTANSAMTDLPATFANALIETLNNQVFVGSLTNPKFYVSAFGNYKDYSFTAAGRLPAEGATGTLDDNLVGFVPQEEDMYITAGKDFWYKTTFTKSADLTKEDFNVKLLKTSPQQAAQSQALISKMKNKVVFISNEPTMDELGRLENILGTPQTDNISDPIKLDFDSYDFTDGSIFYHRYYIYVAIPIEGILRIYNLATKSWEAPQTIPVSRFYVVDGELYGHSYQTSESYKLFDGTNDNGTQIEAIARFSYQNFGTRSELKSFNELYVEGYIVPNTTISATSIYDIDGCSTETTYLIDGDDTQVVCIIPDDGSLGKSPFGQNPLGGSIDTSLTGLPPKFRVIKTFPKTPFYEVQFQFSSIGLDNRFEIIAFGSNAGISTNTNSSIKQ